MHARRVRAAATLLITLLWIFLFVAPGGGSLAQPPEAEPGFSVEGGGSMTDGFTYQGRLSENGAPANGRYDFDIRIYDVQTGGATYWTCIDPVQSMLDVPVTSGLFTFYLMCGTSNRTTFTGGRRWVEVRVRKAGATVYTILPRQPVTAAPYAWSLYPNAQIAGAAISGSYSGATLNISNTSTAATYAALYAKSASGYAVRGEGGGIGVYGYSGDNYAVQGYSVGSVGGKFTSDNGVGIEVQTSGSQHYDHAGTFSANYGYGIYATSSNNNAIRAVGGSSLSGVSQPGGAVGIAGLSATHTGVWGASRDSYGVRGASASSYGVYGSSDAAGSAGLYGRDAGSDPDDAWAVYAVGDIYTSDDLHVAGDLSVTGAKSAAIETAGQGTRLVYSVESPEVWLEDLGSAVLAGGEAFVPIEALFAEVIDVSRLDYKVFLTAVCDEPVLLYVSEKTAGGVTVKGVSLAGEPSACGFDYRISAKRRGYAGARLERAVEAETKLAAHP